MKADERRERWLVLASGVAVMLTVGAAFSWSLYTRPLMALYGWSNLSVALVFSFITFFFGIGAIIGGRLHDHIGPRRAVLLGAALWGAASAFGGLGLAQFGLWWLYIVYGALGGVGCGMLYVVPGATAAKWFPEERGLANGIILCGFGFGSLLFNLAAGAVGGYKQLADTATQVIAARQAALAAGRSFAPSAAFHHDGVSIVVELLFWSGVVYAVVGILSALVLRMPPADFTVPKAAQKLARERNFTPGEMLRTRAFYLIWAIVCVDGTSGLALFSSAVPIYAQASGTTGAAATIAFGWVSAANGIGRLLWAWLSDIIGRMLSLAICLVLEGLGLLWIAYAHGVVPTVTAFAIVLLCFGGIFAIAPAVMADFYGTRFFGEDYSLIITAASVAGIVGPMFAGGLQDALGSLTAWLIPVAVLVIATAIVPFLTREPPATAKSE